MLWLLPILPTALAPLLWLAAPRGRAGLAGSAGGAVAATAGLAGAAVAGGWSGRYAVGPGLELAVALDPVAATTALLVPLVALPIVVYAAVHEEAEGLRRLVAGLVLFVGAMELLVVAADLLTLLVGWEAAGACSWALIAHPGRDRATARSAARAFLATRLGDLGLFVAAAAAFAGAGSFGYDALGTLDPGTLGLVAGGVVVAAAAKSAQLPFSPWLFSAMAGPTAVSALLHAAAMVAAGVFLLARLEGELAVVPWWGPTVLAIGLATALGGGLVAAFQPHAKKLLAASTSAHYGLMGTAVGAGFPAVAVLHLVAHAFLKALLFLAAGMVGALRGHDELSKLRAGSQLPWLAAASALGALALAGVPPLGAAWTKEALVGAAWHHAPWSGVAVALAGALSAAYAFRFQSLAFARLREERSRRSSWAERGPILALAAATVALSLAWWPAFGERAAAWLGGRTPPFRPHEVALSLGLVLLGGYAGRVAVQARSRATAVGPAAGVADWGGLPRLARAAVERPVLRGVRALARFDDEVLDAPARAAEGLVPAGAARLARGDDRGVDAGVRAASRVGVALAHLSARVGEIGLDGLPEGLSRIVDAAGRDARRSQTGLAHHYYAALAALLVVLVAVLAAGGG